ncbi:MAG: hypothetical protein AB7P02_14835 [Alphaproteobacteria bacterium]
MTTMIIIVATIVAAPPYAAWGALWGWVRDQGGFWWPVKPEGAPKNHWKKVGLAVIGLPLAVLALVRWGVDIGDDWWMSGPAAAGLLWAGTAGAWSMGHLGGSGLNRTPSRKGLSTRQAYLAMAASGALVTLPTAIVLAVHDGWVASPATLLAGASKVGWYHLAYIWAELRAEGAPADPPHATLIGAILSAAVALGVSGAALVDGGS